jgi:hypothetical protein
VSVKNAVIRTWCSTIEIAGCERDVRQETMQFVVTLDFRREVDEHCDLLGYYAACSRNSLSTFRDNLSIPSKGTGKDR